MALSVEKFCKMVAYVNNRYGMDVRIGVCDKNSLIPLTQFGKEIGHIDINNESLYLISSDETNTEWE
jgi:hypothetical protein